jgi:hypothetical protein
MSSTIQSQQAIKTPYTGPRNGYVFVNVATDGAPVLVSILDEDSESLASSGPRSSISLGTIVRPMIRWYVLIENPNARSVDVTVVVLTPLI